MWVLFTQDFDFDPPERGGRVTIAYKAGTVANVRRVCGEAAKARKRAVDHPSLRADHGAADGER